jgi:ATP-dependent DNA ligase
VTEISAAKRSRANTEVPAPKKTSSRKIGPVKLSRRGIGVPRLPVKPSPAPLPDFVEPMKAQLADSIRPGDWLYEIKFDGYRALALRGGNQTRILSRNQKDLGKKFAEITSSIAELEVRDAIIDYAASGIMQRIFSSATRRELLGKHLKGVRRGGELKIDWTKPPD